MAFTFLRDTLYTDFLPLFVDDDGVLRGPAADGATASLTRAGVARCVFAILADTALHTGASYDLTGPEDLTLSRAAAIISAETGRTISYHAETIEEAYASRATYGARPGRSTPGSARTPPSPPANFPARRRRSRT